MRPEQLASPVLDQSSDVGQEGAAEALAAGAIHVSRRLT